MTCIVGVVEGGRVYMGGDGGESWGAGWRRTLAIPKVIRVGPYAVGVAGCPRIRGVLLGADLPAPPDGLAPEDMDGFVGGELASAVARTLAAEGVGTDDGGRGMEGELLIGVGGALYAMDPAFAVSRSVHPYDAVGSGAPVALGALYATEGMAPIPRLRVALEAAALHREGVSAPFTFVTG